MTRQAGRSAIRGLARGTGLTLCALLVGLGCARAPRGEEAVDAAPGVTRVRVDRMLDVGTLALLQRGIRSALAADHEVLLIEIDTPGGELELMTRFASMIQEAADEGLLTVGWVNGEATSAGALVALACEKVYMTSTSTIGSATPVSFGPQGMQALPEEGGVRAKVVSYVRAKFRAVAESQRRPTALAEAMVDADVEVREVRVDGERRFMTGLEWDDAITRREEVELVSTIVREGELLNLIGSEAYKLGLTDGKAESLDEVLARIGKPGLEPTTLERSRSEEVLALLEQLAPLLVLAGLILGYMELKAPGFGIPGILSIACFLTLLIGRYMAGLADVPHLVLVVVGLALVATELFLFPGTLWIGFAGGVLVLLGLLAAELGPGFEMSSPLDRQLAIDAAFQLALTAAAALVGIWILSRFLPDVPILNRMVQAPAGPETAFGEAYGAEATRERAARPGALGRALTALRPVGKVVLDLDPASEHEARAEGELLAAGARVRVIAVAAGRLVVEAAPRDPEPPQDREVSS